MLQKKNPDIGVRKPVEVGFMTIPWIFVKGCLLDVRWLCVFFGFSGVIHLRRFQLYTGNKLVVGKGCDLFDAVEGGWAFFNVGNVFFVY